MDTGILKYQPRHGNSRTKVETGSNAKAARTSMAAPLSGEELELLNAAAEARAEWLEVCGAFNYAHDELLVDYFTYRIKACEARYAYYLKLIKARGLSATM